MNTIPASIVASISAQYVFRLAIPAIYIVKSFHGFEQFYFSQREAKWLKKKKKEREEFGASTRRQRMPIILLLVDGSPRRLRVMSQTRVSDRTCRSGWLTDALLRLGECQKRTGSLPGTASGVDAILTGAFVGLLDFVSSNPAGRAPRGAFVAFVIDCDSRASHSCTAQHAEMGKRSEMQHSTMPRTSW